MNSGTAKLQKSLFILLLYASSVSGLIITHYEGTGTMFYLAYDAIIVLLALFSLGSLTGGLLAIILFIAAGITFNFIYTEASLYSSFNGLREIFIVVGLIIFYNKIFRRGNEEEMAEYVNIVRKFTFIFLLAQIPSSIMQFLEYGPTDMVGGTLGNKNGGALTQITVCLIFFMFQFKPGFTQRILLFATLIPLFLNETKISFILIPMMVMFIYFEPKFKNVFLAAVAGVVFLFIFDKFYSHSALDFDDNIRGIFSTDFLEDYLLADIGEYPDVPRLTKIIVGWSIISEEWSTLLFGVEYGMFRTTTSGFSSFSQAYNFLLVGTRPYLFFLQMQGGIFLVSGFFLLIFYINRFFRHANKYSVFLFIILLILMVYHDSFRHHNFSLLYFFLVFYANSSLYRSKDDLARLPTERF